ncbi:Arc family DNA binding domain-containing protein [bacterium]|nr:Arc family DNA binding domain-containing protein [bacterium]
MGEKKSILLRMDPKLWNELNNWAQDELRSLNGQIEYILRESVRRRAKRKSVLAEQDDVF